MNAGCSNSICLTNAIYYTEQVGTSGEVQVCGNPAMSTSAIRRLDAAQSGRLIFILLINMLITQVSGGYIIHQAGSSVDIAMDSHAN